MFKFDYKPWYGLSWVILAFCGLLVLGSGFCQTGNLRPSSADSGEVGDKLAKELSDSEGGDGGEERFITAEVDLDDINFDMFRDYDYRSTGMALKPEVAFRMALVWGAMVLEKAESAGIENRQVVLARDARKIEPELIEAVMEGLRYMGFDVIDIEAEGVNAVSSYSWAVQEFKPVMSIFMTASHVSRPKEEIVRGFKVTQMEELGGTLNSLTTNEIKNVSKFMLEDLVNNPEKITTLKAERYGNIIPANVNENCIRMNTVIGMVAGGRGSLASLAKEISESGNPVDVLDRYEEELSGINPLSGMKVVVDGAHTPSGYLARETFNRLGAEVILINGDIQEIEGEHTADPSKEKNLVELKQAMVDNAAEFGLAFDLDGDRGAIVVPEGKGEGIKFHTLAPDNLIVALLPSLIDDWGYSEIKEGGTNLAVIRDVLGTYGVNEMSASLGVESLQTDAGYVFLKKLRKELLETGEYRVPIYGERSGHCWLEVTGEIENPIALTVLYAVMVGRDKYLDGKTVADNPFYEAYKGAVIPYVQSPRFQPGFHPEFLARLSADEDNDTGWWEYSRENPMSPPQAIIALGKDRGIKALSQEFIEGKKFSTPAGILKIKEFNNYQDDPDTGGLYRFADIVFEDEQGFAGRFIFRASSNDPTFVCSYETPARAGESADDSSKRLMAIGGLVLSWLEDNEVALVTADAVERELGLDNEAALAKVNDGNLVQPAEHLLAFSRWADGGEKRITEDAARMLGSIITAQLERQGWKQVDNFPGYQDPTIGPLEVNALRGYLADEGGIEGVSMTRLDKELTGFLEMKEKYKSGDGGETWRKTLISSVYGGKFSVLSSLSADVFYPLSEAVIEANKNTEEQVHAIIINTKVLTSAEGLFSLVNLMDQVGRDGRVQIVLHVDQEEESGKAFLSEFVRKASDLFSSGRVISIDDLAHLVVYGVSPDSVEETVRKNYNTDLVYVVGEQEYVDEFREVSKVILEPAAELEETPLFSRGLNIAVESVAGIPLDRQRELGFVMDAGEIHVASVNVGQAVAQDLARLNDELSAISTQL